MRNRYPWQHDEPFDYNLAVHKIPAFMDKLHVLHDPDAYLEGPGAWYTDKYESPGGIMLDPDVKPHEQEDALRTDFMPIARYAVHGHSFHQRYKLLRAFVLLNVTDQDRAIWANTNHKKYNFSQLLPADIGAVMLHKWVDLQEPHSGAVAMLRNRAVRH